MVQTSTNIISEASPKVPTDPTGINSLTPTSIKLMNSMDSMVSSSKAIEQEIKNVAAQLAMANELQARFFNKQLADPSQMHRIIQGVVNDTMADSGVKSTRPVSSQSPLPGAHRLVPTSTVPGGNPTLARPDKFTPTTEAQHGNVVGYEPNTFQEGQNHSLGKIRQDVAGHFQTRVSEWQFGGSHGEVTKDDTSKTGYSRMAKDAQGNWNISEASEKEATDFARNQKITQAVKGTIGGLAEGKSVTGAVASAVPMAGRLLGVAGVAYGVANTAANQAVNQRAANAEYQSIFGGSNASATGERFSEKAFSLGQKWTGGMSEQDAATLYKGVAATGMSRGARNEAQDFAVGNYKSMGMSIQDSLKAINLASQDSSVSLASVGQSLRDVSKAAKEAGANANQARQMFLTNWQATAANIGGQGGKDIAAGDTQNLQGLGPDLSKKVDGSAMNSTDINRQIAAQNHLTPLQYTTMAADPTKSVQVAEMRNRYQQTNAQGYFDRVGQKTISDFAKLHANDKQNISEVDKKKLTESLIPHMTEQDGDVMSDLIYKQYGLRVPAADAAEFMTNVALGVIDPTKEARDKAARDQGTTFNKDKLKNFNKLDSSGNQSKDWQNVFKAAGGKSTAGSMAYMQDVGKSGRTSPIIEHLLKDKGKDNIKVKVNASTKDGKGVAPRVVSLDEAIANFSDQLENGTAIIEDSKNKSDVNKPVSEAVGVNGEEGINVTSDKDKKNWNAGTEAGKYDSDHPKREGNSTGLGGKITVELMPGVANLFKINTAGDNLAQLNDPGPKGRPASSAPVMPGTP